MSRTVNIYAYKHDGSFHRFWGNQKIIKETKDYYIVASPKKTKVHESTGYYWFSRELAISYFSKHHWFNIIAMYKDDEVVYYCNMASPIVEETRTLKYIDYDIDVKYFTKTKRIKILDKNEYQRNKQKYDYDKWIDQVVQAELIEIEYWIKHEIGPFSPKYTTDMKKLYELEVNK